MTVLTATGQITSPTTTGNVSYSVTSFTPKAVLFFTNRVAAGSTDVDYWWMVGASTGPVDTESICFTSFSNNGAATSSTANGYDDKTTCIFLNVDNSATIALDADMVSLDATGFTLNWLTVEATGRAIQWVAIGGTGVSCKAGTMVIDNSTGHQSLTGIGFQPKLTLFFNSRVAIGPGGFSLTAQSSTTAGFGAAASSTQQACTSMMSVDNVGTSDTYQRTTDDHCIFIVTTPGFGNVIVSAEFVSHDIDGFTINVDKALANLMRTGFLCIGGDEFQAAVGVDVQPTSNGTSAKTGLGFEPQGIVFCGTSATSLNTTASGLSRCLGVALPGSPATQSVISISDTDAAATTEVASGTSNAACLRFMSGPTPTTDAEAAINSFDSDGYTLNWTKTTGATRRFLYAALGNLAGTSSSQRHRPIGINFLRWRK